MLIGDGLKKLRTSEGLTQREMTDGVMDHSAYGRVENNKSKLSSSNFIQLFQKNNFSIVDFMKDFGDVSSKTRDYQNQVMMAYLRQDKDALKKMLEDRELNNCYIKLAIETMLDELDKQHVNKDKINKLKNIMTEIDNWDENSLWILLVIMRYFEFHDLKSLVDSTFDRFKKYSGKNIELINILASIAVVYLEICWSQKNCTEIKKAINFLKELPAVSEIAYQKAIGLYYEAKINSDQKLINKMTDFFEIYRDLKEVCY